MRTALFLGLSAGLLVNSQLCAQITKLSGGGYENGVVANTVTNDISIDFTGQYTGSQMIIELTAGEIYFDPVGAGFVPQNSAFFSLAPSLEYHSHIANGILEDSASNGDANSAPWGNPSIQGGAVNLGGAAGEQFDETTVNIAWGPLNPVVDQFNFLTSRITLSDDAQGTWSYMASADGVFGVVEEMPITNGYMYSDLTGDYDDNAYVSASDLDIALLNWGTSSFPGNPAAIPGGSFDGLVSQNEIDGVLNNWGKNFMSPWSIVPAQIDPLDTPGTETGLQGDFNGSGQVEQADWDLVLRNEGPVGDTYPEGWVNDFPDGFISCCDEGTRVLSNWGNTVVASTQSIPEPTSVLLLALASVGLITGAGFSARRSS